MRFSCVLIFSSILLAQAPVAQKPAPSEMNGQEVVATVGSKSYTASDVQEMINSLPPQFQQRALMDKKGALEQILMERYLADEARSKGLDKQSPYKEQIELMLAQVALNDYSNHIVIPQTEIEKYYKDHPDEFKQARVRMIQIAYSSGQVKSDIKVRTQEQAKAKVDELRKQLVSGADFAELAKNNSDDKESGQKGGEWGVIKSNSKLPDPIKKAIFSLKPGEVSQPLEQPNGYYLVRVDEITVQPLSDVSKSIDDTLRQQRFNTWMQSVQHRFDVKVEKPDFFKSQPVAPAAR